MTSENPWAFWQAELMVQRGGFVPTADHPRQNMDPPYHDTPIDGYWRMMGARTKPDFPVAIWRDASTRDHVVLQIGRRTPQTVAVASQEWQNFVALTFPKCAAVHKAAWDDAITSGRWADGKMSRETTDAERMDVIPDTPAEQGGNVGPSVAEQIAEKIAALVEKAKAVGRVDTAEQGQVAAQIATDLKALHDLGEQHRKAEKKPYDDGAKAVQAKWVPILEPAVTMRDRLVTAIDVFRRAEQRRLQAEADAKAEAERQRIRAETEARMKAEAEASAKLAEQMGMEAQTPTDDEIAAEAEQVAAEAVVADHVDAPRVGPAYGRAISRARRRGGRIVDARVFALALIDAADDDILAALQKRADALARSKVKMAGYEIIEEN